VLHLEPNEHYVIPQFALNSICILILAHLRESLLELSSSSGVTRIHLFDKCAIGFAVALDTVFRTKWRKCSHSRDVRRRVLGNGRVISSPASINARFNCTSKLRDADGPPEIVVGERERVNVDNRRATIVSIRKLLLLISASRACFIFPTKAFISIARIRACRELAEKFQLSAIRNF